MEFMADANTTRFYTGQRVKLDDNPKIFVIKQILFWDDTANHGWEAILSYENENEPVALVDIERLIPVKLYEPSTLLKELL